MAPAVDAAEPARSTKPLGRMAHRPAPRRGVGAPRNCEVRAATAASWAVLLPQAAHDGSMASHFAASRAHHDQASTAPTAVQADVRIWDVGDTLNAQQQLARS